MGQARQSVQRLVDVMTGDGLLSLTDNPNHKRAKLVSMTPKGKKIYGNMEKLQIPWANGRSAPISRENLEITLQTLKFLSESAFNV
jgi:DNA-binding MarR family transcriptional regulator